MKLRTFGFVLGLFIALAPACGGDDDDAGSGGTVDSGSGGSTIDSGTGGGAPDGGAGGGAPDSGSGGAIDSGPGGAPDSGTGGGIDAAVAPTAQEFCSDYEAACGFGAPGKYESLSECIAAFRTSPADRFATSCN